MGLRQNRLLSYSSVEFTGCDCGIVPTIEAILGDESFLFATLLCKYEKLFALTRLSSRSLLDRISIEGAVPQGGLDD